MWLRRGAIARVSLFLVALVIVRGFPALLQATSLPFIVAASMIGMELGLLDAGTGRRLIAAGCSPS